MHPLSRSLSQFAAYDPRPVFPGAAGGPSPAGSRHASGSDHAPTAAEPRPSRPAPHPHLESPVISPARLAKMTPQELMAVR